jgi:hypothetical protein
MATSKSGKAKVIKQDESILDVLRMRFENNMQRHHGLQWQDVEKKLLAGSKALEALSAMENSGGEPDVVGFDRQTGRYIFFDCSPETPAGRRSLCYDREALNARKENKPVGDALSMAQNMGIEILTEDDYRFLQTLGSFDLKTSSWIKTPDMIRKLDGALFCDRRYDTVFTYHNGAQSYYAARAFRGKLLV